MEVHIAESHPGVLDQWDALSLPSALLSQEGNPPRASMEEPPQFPLSGRALHLRLHWGPPLTCRWDFSHPKHLGKMERRTGNERTGKWWKHSLQSGNPQVTMTSGTRGHQPQPHISWKTCADVKVGPEVVTATSLLPVDILISKLGLKRYPRFAVDKVSHIWKQLQKRKVPSGTFWAVNIKTKIKITLFSNCSMSSHSGLFDSLQEQWIASLVTWQSLFY